MARRPTGVHAESGQARNRPPRRPVSAAETRGTKGAMDRGAAAPAGGVTVARAHLRAQAHTHTRAAIGDGERTEGVAWASRQAHARG
eukprot:6193193-Pleurochrysis_carterae.AAC.1